MHGHRTSTLGLLGALLALTGCGSSPADPASQDGAESVVDSPASDPSLGGVDTNTMPLDEHPRLAAWPSEGSRLRLQLAEAGVLEFARSGNAPGDAPEAADWCHVGSERLVVRVGPVGEWYANDSLYLLLDAQSPKVLAAGVYIHSDMGGMGGWGTVYGTVWCAASDSGSPGERVRCGYELYSDEARKEAWFVGQLQLDAALDSSSLRSVLESFGVNAAE